jgi:hypothetical protein
MRREVRARGPADPRRHGQDRNRAWVHGQGSEAESCYQCANGHLAVIVRRHSSKVLIDELNDRVLHEPTQQELRDQKRYSWTRIPTHDQVQSGWLRINFDPGGHVRQVHSATT